MLLYIEEIKTTPENENQFNISSKHFITKEVKEKAKKQIEQDIIKTVELCKNYKTDVLEINKMFKKYSFNYYKTMLDFYGSEERFFSNCEVETEIIVKDIL